MSQALDVKRTRKRTPKRGRPPLYPWDEWTDGGWWQVDMDASEISGFRSNLYKAAKRLEMQVESEVEDRTLYFRFLKKQPAKRGSK